MDLSFKTFREFMQLDRPDSDSEVEDEVFFAGKCPKVLRYANRKTEQFDPNFRTNRKSLSPSEEYFADSSRLSSGEEKDQLLPVLETSLPGQATEIVPSQVDLPCHSLSPQFFPSEPEAHLVLGDDNLASRALETENGVEHNGSAMYVDMRPRDSSHRPKILSFQHFTSSSGSWNENEIQKADLNAPNRSGVAKSTVDLMLDQVWEKNYEADQNHLSSSAKEIACVVLDEGKSLDENYTVKFSVDLEPSQNVEKLEGLTADESFVPSIVHVLDGRLSTTDAEFSGESPGRCDVNLVKSPCDLTLNRNFEKEKELPAVQICAFSNTGIPECAGSGVVLQQGSGEAISPRLPAQVPVLSFSDISPVATNLQLDQVSSGQDIHKSLEQFQVHNSVIGAPASEEQDKIIPDYVADGPSSDVALADVNFPSILLGHFESCNDDEEKLHEDAGQESQEGRHSPDTSLNSPGFSGGLGLRLRLETETSFESDCDYDLEALRRWNLHLMETDKKSRELSTVQSSDVTHDNTPPTEVQTRPRDQFATNLEMNLPGGKGSVSTVRRPSPLISALQLSPQKFVGREEPSNLECLDLSVDDRLPVNRYLEEMDKENCHQQAKRRLSENRKTPIKPSNMLRETTNSPALFSTPNPPHPTKVASSQKKTGIPVMESRLGEGRHGRCFNMYSTNKFAELKAKSMKDFQHISSPISQYIRECPVPPLVLNIRPKPIGLRAREKNTPIKTFFPPPTPQSNIPVAGSREETPSGVQSVLVKKFFPVASPLTHLPVARYMAKEQLPHTVEQPPRKYKYFPSPKTPLVIKHTGPSHVIPDVSCLHGDESIVSSRPTSSRIPHLKGDVDKSFWEVVSPKSAGKK